MTADRPQAAAKKPSSPLREARAAFARNKAGVLGLVLLTLVVALAAIGPFVYPVDPFEIVSAPLTPPLHDAAVPLGSDYLGRDLLAGIVHGARVTLFVGGAAAAMTVTIGIVIGASAGYWGGRIDGLLMRLTEFFQVLPPLLFAMALVTLFTPSIPIIAFAIGLVSWPAMARLTRAEFLKIKPLGYVAATRSGGGGDGYLIWRVILPNAAPPLIVSAALVVGMAILFEAGLSFLGLGDPNVMSWGLIIGANREYIIDGWWTVTFPGFAVFVTVLGLSLIGDGLNDAFNPNLRER
ncbi:ABC transporter permease [Aquibium sp. A9E412]|uniref:ABC transporter permease n=1 Tax=Aquibium sp. A9E412 TaxID=2976767 RepID=UPI0025B0886A|nr:ABC transporter permease [Aquibium sp. A9E412]MDN2566121.1 ABC transporter permease [Aquibium sp. A9E412]